MHSPNSVRHSPATSCPANDWPNAAAVDPIRILIADDHPVFRFGLRQLLATQRDFEVVGEAGSADETILLANTVNPQVLLLDVSMPRATGFDALRALQNRNHVRTVMLTASIGRHGVATAMTLGARGVLLKDSAPEQLFKCVRSVHAGELWLGRHEMADIIGALGVRGRERSTATLTAREREVMKLVALGHSNRQIAGELSVSEDTIKHHITNIFDKVGASNRVELTLFAHREELVTNA